MKLPVSRQVLDAAIVWRLRHDAGEADAAALEAWLASDEAHARAWYQLQQIDQHVGSIGRHGSHALRQTAKASRRRALGTATALLLVIAAVLPLANREWPLRHIAADYVTATGEQRRLSLDDGTRIQLDARSALNIDFDADQRRLQLRVGQLWVQTAHGDERPFVVVTEEGELRALGTRFTVQRLEDGRTRLVVLESAVEATASDGERRIVPAGDSVLLDAGGLAPTRPAEAGAAAWTEGMLAVEDVPLDDVIDVLSRHTTAYLSVDPQIANLRVTGTFPLHDIDLALASLAVTLPVSEHRVADLLVRLQPAEKNISP